MEGRTRTTLNIVIISCMRVGMSTPPVLGFPHFSRFPDHSDGLLSLVALREHPFHGAECVQAYLDPIFDVHTQFESVALTFKVTLRQHEPSKETSVFD